MKIRAEIAALERSLCAEANPERAAGEKRYLKSRFDFLGVGTPEMRRLIKAWLAAHPDLEAHDLRRLARALFARRVHELKAVAIELLFAHHALLEPEDLALIEQMLRRSYTWAYVDALSVHLVGPLVERFPELIPEIDRWAKDDDFWIRRSALLSLLLPLRRGEGDWQRFVGYAEPMLEEREFFIRKAIGWVLREVSKKHPRRVAGYVRPRIDRLSGVTFREAVKYLESADRGALQHLWKTRKRGGNSARQG